MTCTYSVVQIIRGRLKPSSFFVEFLIRKELHNSDFSHSSNHHCTASYLTFFSYIAVSHEVLRDLSRRIHMLLQNIKSGTFDNFWIILSVFRRLIEHPKIWYEYFVWIRQVFILYAMTIMVLIGHRWRLMCVILWFKKTKKLLNVINFYFDGLAK
jgi:hypothetical protein